MKLDIVKADPDKFVLACDTATFVALVEAVRICSRHVDVTDEYQLALHHANVTMQQWLANAPKKPPR